MKYTAEEVRDYANACRLVYKGTVIADMLTELAERIEADESAVPNRSETHEPDCNLNMASIERQFMGCDCKLSVPFQKGHPPAQAAQVGVIGTLEPLVRELETTTVPNVVLKQITLLGKFADASRKLISEAMNASTAQPVAQGEAVQQEEYGGPDFEERCETLAKIERDMRIYLDEGMLLTPYTLELLCNRIKNVRDAGHDNVVMSLYNFRTLRHLAAQPREVPDGWVLVPREPTEAMLDAAMTREDDEPLTDWGKIIPAPHEEIYKAMLAAAPQSGEST